MSRVGALPLGLLGRNMPGPPRGDAHPLFSGQRRFSSFPPRFSGELDLYAFVYIYLCEYVFVHICL